MRGGAPHGSDYGMDFVMYIRRQPWRPRSPWLGARMGARRRGFRQDALAPAPDEVHDGVDVVVATADDAVLDDTVLAVDVAEPAVQTVIPARVDISGLQAIAALAPDRFSPSAQDGAFSAIDWRAFGQRSDEELDLARHSA